MHTHTRTHTLLQVCTGALAGLVSITGGCSVVEPWAAVVCGVVASFIAIYGDVLMEKLKIDDPVRACVCVRVCVAVHQ